MQIIVAARMGLTSPTILLVISVCLMYTRDSNLQNLCSSTTPCYAILPDIQSEYSPAPVRKPILPSPPNRKNPIPLPSTTTTILLVPNPHLIKTSPILCAHDLLFLTLATFVARVLHSLIVVSVLQHPPNLSAPVVFIQKPILPFGTQHFALDGVDDAHRDEEVVAVGSEGLTGALEAAGGGAGWLRVGGVHIE